MKLHHANLVIGNNCHDFVFGILRDNFNFEAAANPDFLLVENDSFGIDDARDLIEWSFGKPLFGEIKASFIISKSITSQAQNALLKILEEPPLGTYFFIQLESIANLLSTFISRTQILKPTSEDNAEGNIKNPNDKTAKDFLNSNISKRLAILHSFSKDDKNGMADMIGKLEKIAGENYLKKYPSGKSAEIDDAEKFRNILTAKMFSSIKGSSQKMLVEWLSCVL